MAENSFTDRGYLAVTTHPHSRLTHLPLQDVDFPASFAADFISEIIKATEKDSTGSDSYHSWKEIGRAHV